MISLTRNHFKSIILLMFENDNLKTLLANAGYFIMVTLAVFTVTFTLLYFANLVPKSFQGEDRIEEEASKIINTDGKVSENTTPLTATKPTKITIDKIGVSSVIGHPNSQDVAVLDSYLPRGAVYYRGSGTIEQGNIFLFGHSTGLQVVRNQAYKTFSGLNKLIKGDEITLWVDTSKYIYKVTSVRLMDENSALVSFDKTGRTLTISTCNTFGQKQERWVVEAVFDREV